MAILHDGGILRPIHRPTTGMMVTALDEMVENLRKEYKKNPKFETSPALFFATKRLREAYEAKKHERKPIICAPISFSSNAEKILTICNIALDLKTGKITDERETIEEAMMISEGWSIEVTHDYDSNRDGRPTDHKDRIEILHFIMRNSAGDTYARAFTIKRSEETTELIENMEYQQEGMKIEDNLLGYVFNPEKFLREQLHEDPTMPDRLADALDKMQKERKYTDAHIDEFMSQIDPSYVRPSKKKEVN